MAQAATQGIDFKTDASVKEPLLVASMAGEEAISAPYAFRLEFICRQADIKLEEMVRQPASLG